MYTPSLYIGVVPRAVLDFVHAAITPQMEEILAMYETPINIAFAATQNSSMHLLLEYLIQPTCIYNNYSPKWR